MKVDHGRHVSLYKHENGTMSIDVKDKKLGEHISLIFKENFHIYPVVEHPLRNGLSLVFDQNDASMEDLARHLGTFSEEYLEELYKELNS